MCNRLVEVIDHHCQLIGPETVGPLQYEIARLARQLLALWPVPSVAPVDAVFSDSRHPQPERPCELARRQTVTAGAGIDRRAVGANAQLRVGDFASAATAGIDG